VKSNLIILSAVEPKFEKKDRKRRGAYSLFRGGSERNVKWIIKNFGKGGGFIAHLKET